MMRDNRLLAPMFRINLCKAAGDMATRHIELRMRTEVDAEELVGLLEQLLA